MDRKLPYTHQYAHTSCVQCRQLWLSWRLKTRTTEPRSHGKQTGWKYSICVQVLADVQHPVSLFPSHIHTGMHSLFFFSSVIWEGHSWFNVKGHDGLDYKSAELMHPCWWYTIQFCPRIRQEIRVASLLFGFLALSRQHAQTTLTLQEYPVATWETVSGLKLVCVLAAGKQGFPVPFTPAIKDRDREMQ